MSERPGAAGGVADNPDAGGGAGAPEARAGIPGGDGAVISTRGLTKLYEMGTNIVEALVDVDLDIDRNEFLAIMGPSGSGKSTLMNLIGCLDTPTRGSYVLNDQEVSELDDNELAAVRNREIGFIFQTFNLLPRATALHNVELPLIYAGVPSRRRRERALETLEEVGLGDRSDHRPSELSGGQRQRVAIARALVNKPSILLADEPTGNLDSKTSYEIMELFVDLHRRGHTILLVTHEEDIAEYARRVIRLLDGRVVEDALRSPGAAPPGTEASEPPSSPDRPGRP